ncbi:Peroxisomal biogenesis factor 3 [Geodia barretti]|uniref:Peroxisomal biogenesis factor 3 n=1 Tax=Geodia barretti TaxID=519541 RepID=A0AA35WRF4_GEOBA|nr:Peroxisomal biogenesis factor 3 [Geodia barretti]
MREGLVCILWTLMPVSCCMVYTSHVCVMVTAGLEALVGRVRKAAETVLLSYSLKHQLTAEGVGQLLSDIHSLSSSHRPTNSSKGVCQTSFLVQFLLPRDQSFQSPEETSGAAYSARDIIESAEFSMVLERCVNQTFSLMCCQISDIHHSAAQRYIQAPSTVCVSANLSLTPC